MNFVNQGVYWLTTRGAAPFADTIAFRLLDPKLSVRDAVASAAREWELEKHLDRAEEDVSRALAALTT